MKQYNGTLEQFIAISIQKFQQQHEQFRQQQQFNGQFLNGLNELNQGFKQSVDQQNIFNERFLNKLDDIEKALKK